jgi:two-component system, NarL family, sensor kinase
MRDLVSLEAVSESASLDPNASTIATRLQALFEHSPVAIVALDHEHRFVMCNPAFIALFQFTQEEMLATDIDQLIAAPDTTNEARNLSLTVLRGEKVHTVAQRRRKDGMIVDVEIYGIPLIVDGILNGVYGVYQDVTERNHAKTAYKQLSQMLSDAQHEERRRVARDLHDSTSQELAVLNWNLTMLSKMVGDRDATLQGMVAQTKEIALQCSSRIRSASYLLHPPLLGNEGLQPIVSRLATEFELRSGIHVTLDIQDSLGRFADVIEITIFRVLQEALANVMRHSGSPVVHLSLWEQSGWLTLIVSDEGRKVAMANLKNDRTGVGVSGMRERLEQLGGHLRMEQTNDGTTVISALPIDRETNA